MGHLTNDHVSRFYVMFKTFTFLKLRFLKIAENNHVLSKYIPVLNVSFKIKAWTLVVFRQQRQWQILKWQTNCQTDSACIYIIISGVKRWHDLLLLRYCVATTHNMTAGVKTRMARPCPQPLNADRHHVTLLVIKVSCSVVSPRVAESSESAAVTTVVC